MKEFNTLYVLTVCVRGKEEEGRRWMEESNWRTRKRTSIDILWWASLIFDDGNETRTGTNKPRRKLNDNNRF